MVYFFSCYKQITIDQYARLFIDHVFKLHGFHQVIIFDTDPCFLTKFWDKLFWHLGMDLLFSTISHSQIDGQLEVKSKVMENFL